MTRNPSRMQEPTSRRPAAGCPAAPRIALALVLTVAALTGFVVSPAQAQDRSNVELLSNFNPRAAGRTSYMDVWGYTAPDGTELAIFGSVLGVSFVDVTDPRNPVEVAFMASGPSTHRDFRTYGHYAYAVNENGGGGMEIYDLSNPRQPFLVSIYDATFDMAHNVGIYDGFLYAIGARKELGAVGTRILDLTDPVNPIDVGAYESRYLHDLYVRDGIGYGAAIQDRGIAVIDFEDKSNPREISFAGTGASTHNAWLTDDGRHLLTTDEQAGGHLRIWDVTDRSSPTEVASWSAHPSASIHNVVVLGDTAYASYYTEGLRVIDISNPLDPFEVAYFDTWPGASGGFSGNWGVYPYAQSGNIYLSDISTGLYVVRLNASEVVADFALADPPERKTAFPGMTTIFYSFEITNTALTTRSYTLTVTNNLGWSMDYPQTVSIPGSASDAPNVIISVPDGVAAPTPVDVQLCVRSVTTGFLACASTDPSVPVTLQSFSVEYRSGMGVNLSWSVDRDIGDEGSLAVLRAPATSPEAWNERARLPLADGSYTDRDVEVGRSYVYALALDGPAGLQLLGQRALRIAAPERSRIVGNWPNPFNPYTRIRFEIARPGDVILSVFDGRGRFVRRIVERGLAAGSHDLQWNGQDARGNSQPSGVYFYEVQSGSWRDRGRMTLTR